MQSLGLEGRAARVSPEGGGLDLCLFETLLSFDVSQSYRMARVGRDLQDHLFPIPLP